MGTQSDAQAREEVLRAWRAQVRAMVEGDTEALEDLLDEGFTLTHTSGCVRGSSTTTESTRRAWTSR